MRESGKKVLFLTSRLPYPASSGRKNVMYNYCKILNEKLGYEVVNVSFLEQGDDLKLKPEFIKKTYTLNKVSTKNKLKNVIIKTFIKQQLPIQVSIFSDEKNKEIVNEIIDKEKPDIVIADMVRMTEYAKDWKGYKIADLDDLLSIRYKRQLQIDDIDILNPYGAYLYSLPKFAQKILSIKSLKMFILKKEIKLLTKYEIEISKLYDNVVFVAENEAKLLNSKLNSNKSYGVPLGVDVDYFSQKLDINKENDTISFLGVMNVTHNEAAVIHFIRDILPLILSKKPNAKFYVVGGGVTDKLKAYESDNVIFTGRVEDVRTVIGKTSVFVCPLIFGSGIKTKNLEAMAMGVPVVTTSIGAENINAVDGVDFVVRDDDKEFAQAVLEIMDDKIKSEEIQKNALQFVVNNFTWDVAEKKLKAMLEENM